MFTEAIGSFEICEICFWEDDNVQLGFPLQAGGANQVSLVQAQLNYAAIGVSDPRLKEYVRPPQNQDLRDPDWRPFNPETDPHLKWNSTEHERLWLQAPDDRRLYYWRRDYWLLNRGSE